MKAVDELLKNLLLRENRQASRKRRRPASKEDRSYVACRNTKTRQESSDTDLHSSEAKSTKQGEKNFS